jgi:rubrerythrin
MTMSSFILFIYNFFSVIFICDMIYKILKNILNRLFGHRWICEHCGRIEHSIEQPYCKPCCHIEITNKKMIRIK